MSDDWRPSGILEFPDRLTLPQLFRLVEIAHETSNHDIRKHALGLLEAALAPPLRMVPRDPNDDGR